MPIILTIRFLVLVLIINLNCTNKNPQEPNSENIKLINNFLNTLVDNTIPSKEVVDKFLVIELDNEENLNDKKDAVCKLIELARADRNKENNWKIVNSRVFELDSDFRKIYEYQKHKHLSNVNLNVSEKELKNAYVLLDNDSKEILQYFLVKNKKIYSFNLFIQGNEAWFFSYN